MTHAQTPPPTPRPDATLTRRRIGGAVAAGLASAAVLPLAEPAPASADRRTAHRHKPGRKWHRCKVHTSHTCWHARTCPHRKHKPATGPTAQPPPPPNDPPVQQPPSPGTDLPTAAALHLASRFSYGMTPTLFAEMKGLGSAEAWFAAQLQPATVADQAAEQLQSWWASIDLDPVTIWERNTGGVEPAWVAMANYQRWCLLRRIYSRRQVLEVVAEFFEGHLHVPVQDDGVFGFRAAYGKLIRDHTLGRFDDLLVAAITHPAMGISLDNATSTKRAPNENLGRELLELHTVGRGNYTEDDVKSSARILTGYRVDLWNTWNAWYDTGSHWTGPVQVMGFSDPNASADGRAVAEAYLRYLARHPATARRLARKLAVRFVSDTPSDSLVDHLAAVYQDNDTGIVPVLRALVAHPEFVASAGAKVRTPTDDLVATYRALDVVVARPVDDDSAANTLLWQAETIGQTPFGWTRPDGPPEDGAAWSSASRLLSSFEVHYVMCGGWWPTQDTTYHPLRSWVPLSGDETMRFDALVDHLSRTLLCRAAAQRVLDACCLATGLTPATTITTSHPLVRWQLPVLLTAVLDSPEHMCR
jgi:uncharacterized protein (DUF1800 family)